jgi:hypothetical protein
MGRGWKLWPLKKTANKGAAKPGDRDNSRQRGSVAKAKTGLQGELVFIPSLRSAGAPPSSDPSHPAPLGRAPLIVPVRQLDLIGRLQHADDEPEVMQPAPQSSQERERSKRSLTLSSLRAPRIKRAKRAKKDVREPQKGRESA